MDFLQKHLHFNKNSNADSNLERSSNLVAPSASANKITAPLQL